MRLLLLIPTTSYRTEDFVEAAHRLGVDLTIGSEEAPALAPHNPFGHLVIDFSEPERLAVQVRGFARRAPVDAVVGVDDVTALPAAAIAEALGLRHSPLASVAAARDKLRARQAMRAAGVPIPEFRALPLAQDPEEAAPRLPYPCVLKPLNLSASRGVMRADDPQQFIAAYHRLRAILAEPWSAAEGDATEYLVETYVPGREVALEGLLVGGDLRVLCLFDKPDPMEGPFFEETLFVTPSRLPEAVQSRVAEVAAQAAEALGLREGPIHAELRVNDAGPWVIEVNPRSIGGRCSRALRFGTGMTLEELILRHALGMEIPTFDRESGAAGVLMLPVREAGVLKGVSGREDAESVPGVEEVQITQPPGTQLRPLPEGSPYLGFVFARGETPEEVETALREAHRRLRVTLDPAVPTELPPTRVRVPPPD